jgi:hypothetical protein
MPSANREPGPDDMPLPDMPVPARPAYDTVDFRRPRNSLSRALTPEYLGLEASDYMDLTPEMIDFVQPDKLRDYLIDVPPKSETSPFAVSYYDRSQNTEHYIAVTPREAKLLPRHVEAIKRSAAINTAAKVVTGVLTDTDIARVERSKIHVQETKLPALITYRDSLLKNDEMVTKFFKNSRGRNYGLSMFGGEINMRESINYLQTFIIGDMVKAYAAQRRLNETQTDQVGRAIEYSYVFRSEKFDNFHNLMAFLHEYNNHKVQLASQRIEAMERNIGRYLVQESQR